MIQVIWVIRVNWVMASRISSKIEIDDKKISMCACENSVKGEHKRSHNVDISADTSNRERMVTSGMGDAHSSVREGRTVCLTLEE